MEEGLIKPVNTPRHQGRKTTCGSPNARLHHNIGSGEGCQIRKEAVMLDKGMREDILYCLSG